MRRLNVRTKDNREQGPRPNKLLGQHFLVSRDVLENIIAAANLTPEKTILEIGPGRGVLTRELARRVQKVIAVEKDVRLAEALTKALREERMKNVTIVFGDILKLFPQQLNLPDRYSVVANIPYYLTGRLLRILLESRERPAEITLMVQNEVADRMMASPPHMNLLAIAAQAYGTVRKIATVPARAFSPVPKVDSAITSISNISDRFFKEAGVSSEKFFLIVRSAFQQKRKTLANALERVLGGKTRATLLLGRAHVSPGMRPEELSLASWADIVRLASGKKISL